MPTPAVKVEIPASFKEDLKPFPNPPSRNAQLRVCWLLKQYYWLCCLFPHKARVRVQQQHVQLIQETKAETAAKEEKAKAKKEIKKRKKFVPKKPTKDEKGILNRLKKHNATLVPAYEKTLADKYSLKKKAAPVAAAKKK